MCGIVGTYWYAGGVADRGLVARQCRLLEHRGPDDAGLWDQGPIALGHRRLAIHDTSPAGRQPLSNEDGSVWISFNGEIYDWRRTRDELAGRGHAFRGECDSEILPHLWEERGEGMLEAVRGMFAFALFDTRRRVLMLARDRLGKKPLYYHDDGRRIVFASELKALMLDPTVPRELDPHALADMLAFQYVPTPGSIWQGVRKLAPGERLTCDARGPRLEKFWTFPSEPPCEREPRDAVAGLRDLLVESVRLRSRSDVPIGALLSGGIDSSAVAALLSRELGRPIETFSVGFDDERVSELPHARQVARHLGALHHEIVVGPESLALLPNLAWHFDEPFADASLIPTFLLAKLARQHVTVVLSGDGGDEVFGGYSTYLKSIRHARLDPVPMNLRRLLARSSALVSDPRLARRLSQLEMDVVDRHLDGMSRFARSEAGPLLGPALRQELNGHDPLRAARAIHQRARQTLGEIPALLALDAQTYMSDDVLAKVDRLSMANSLEVRAPLLDQKVVEYVARLPFSLKVRGSVTKWVLREAVKDWLPEPILQRPKQGFGLPLGRWYDPWLHTLAGELLLDPSCRERGWFDPRATERLVNGPAADPGRRAHQVFALCCLELWARAWLDRPRECAAAPPGESI